MPGIGLVADPGLVVVMPGSGEIMMPPVSVCHQVSMIGQRPPPMRSWYQSQASGMIGSPTEPSTRRADRAKPAGRCSPHLMEGWITGGAGERTLNLEHCKVSHQAAVCRG